MASVLSSNEHNNDSQIPEVYKTRSQWKHNIRNASGRFRKAEAIDTRKQSKINMLHEGFKKWNAKRKLHIISKENEPPAKRMTRALEVSRVFFTWQSLIFGKIFLPSLSYSSAYLFYWRQPWFLPAEYS